MSLTRALLPTAVVLTVLPFAAGCAGPGPGSRPPAAESPATASPATVPPATVPPATVPPATVPPATASGPSGADVYFAESQDAHGTTVREPACRDGCPVSGDGTTVLWDMSWPVWTGVRAVGTGTERIDSCDPDCAVGRQYSVRVTVTFSHPVRDCGGGDWLWTRASFAWPDGLPAALRGDRAPVNPWDFSQLRAQAAQSCG